MYRSAKENLQVLSNVFNCTMMYETKIKIIKINSNKYSFELKRFQL